MTTIPLSLIFLRGQAEYMRRIGIELLAISTGGEALARFGKSEGVATYPVGMERRITPLRDLRALFRLVRLLSRLRPDVVHAHTPKGGLLGMLAATLAGIPGRIYQMRGLPMATARGPRRRLLRWTERVSCRLAHRVFAISESLREEAVAEGLCAPGKIAVLGSGGNGVDAEGRFDPDRIDGARAETRDRLGIPGNAKVIGFVGRLVRDKGIVELEGAWRELRNGYPDTHLLLVGPAEAKDPVPPEVLRRLAEDARVHMLGLAWDTPPLYAAMDVVALPTYREGFPNVAVEAAAMRLPVVATRVTGCVDAVHDGETGTLVSAGSVEELRSALERYLRDPTLRRAHGEAGRARVLQEFRRETVWAALQAEYLRLLPGGPPSERPRQVRA